MLNMINSKKLKIVNFIKMLSLCLAGVLFFTGGCWAEQEEEQCLEFSLTKYEDERKAISSFVGIPKAYEKIIKLYVAVYDLNEDGAPEIFTHIEGGSFCGNQTGCQLDIYKYNNKKLVSITRSGFPTFFEFKADNNLNQKYICVSPNLNDGWHNIVLKGKNEKSFDGKYYRRVSNN